MKRIILLSLFTLALASTATAAVKPLYKLIVELPEGAVQTLSNSLLKQEVTKFVDGKTTCYIVATKQATNIQSSASISCVN